MIPLDFITEWRQTVPWVDNAQVEKDLIISRALAEMYKSDDVYRTMAFRGGTALFKLFHTPAARYSEDIDLVQIEAGPIGRCLDAVRRTLDPWLGDPRRLLKEGRAVLVYRVSSEEQPGIPIRLKVEINTREHFSILGFKDVEYRVESRWFTGEAAIRTYELDEMLGTKLRALYQRRKGRDLFDLWYSARQAKVSEDRVIECFNGYLEQTGSRISRAEFEANLYGKLSDPGFLGDVLPLLAPGYHWDAEDAGGYVMGELLSRMPGDPWKGAAIDDLE